MSNEGGDYATVLGTLCVASGQHSWNVYVNHVEDSNLFIGVTVGGHDLNADPQEMKSRTYYLSNGTIRVAGGSRDSVGLGCISFLAARLCNYLVGPTVPSCGHCSPATHTLLCLSPATPCDAPWQASWSRAAQSRTRRATW
jgi:hypothetical protein